MRRGEVRRVVRTMQLGCRLSNRAIDTAVNTLRWFDTRYDATSTSCGIFGRAAESLPLHQARKRSALDAAVLDDSQKCGVAC
jgi:hypothetical protein